MSTLPQQTTHGFLTETTQTIPEINGTAYTMRHTYSGAQLLYLNTEDEEKGFTIAFRTPPADNTGVFHILEHSVLRGSDKYPVKEPFVHLLKSSMKTFLNAATASDYTMFPVASTNDKDLMNLMSVYLDAVFHPAILHEPRIFKQEGWHYEYDGEQLAATGVVYNEMKGMLAQPNAALTYALNEELFPDTAYRYVAGGVPGQIESLSYEQLIDAYERHYKPSNAAIVLYGQIDTDVFLPMIDEYLRAAHDQAQSRHCGEPNAVGSQAPVISTGRKVYLNALPQDAGIMFKSVFCETSDLLRKRAMDILVGALFGSNEAPLTRKLLDAGIATRVRGETSYSPMSSVTINAFGVNPESATSFLETLQDGCREILSAGISKDLLEAAAFSVEFDQLSNEGQGKPNASDQMMDCLATWAASGTIDARSISYEADFKFLKSAIQTDYYERLLEEAFLESDHYAMVELCPIPADEEQDARPAEKRPDSATINRVLQEMEDLKLFHDMPDSPEALKALPHLDRNDCLKVPRQLGYELDDSACIPALRHEYREAGLAHIVRYYDISTLSLEDFRYLDVLIWIISETDTLRHTAAEVVQMKNGRLGIINSQFVPLTNYRDGSLGACVWIYTCSLADDIDFNVSFIDEILHETVYTSREKLRETVNKLFAYRKGFAVESLPHLAASMRAEAHVSPAAVLEDARMGVSGFAFMRDLKERLTDDAEADKVLRRLQLISARVFGVRPALVSFAGDDSVFDRFMAAECALVPTYEEQTACILSNLTDEEAGYASHPFVSKVKPISSGDEAFIIPGDVAYCAEAIDVSGTPNYKSGRWNIAGKAASLDYLWNEVRLKGSAYGVSFSEYDTGVASFNSFRDPNVDETLESFDGLGAWLRDFSPSDDEFDGYVISATAAFDQPVRGFNKLFQQDFGYLRGKTPDDRARMRQEIVSCTAQDIRDLGKELDECTGKRCKVVIGSLDLIEQSIHDFAIKVLE